MSDTRLPLRVPKPWKMELLWAKEGDHFGSRRIRSFETEQSRDAAIADAQASGWQVLRTWREALTDDPLTGANCHWCGDTADNFHVADDLWAKVEPILGQNQSCFKCFRKAAWHIGIRPTTAWEVSVGCDHQSNQAEDAE